MKFSVVTPKGSVVDCVASEVTIPGALGEFTILPQHRPSVLMVGGGQLSYVSDSQTHRIWVKGGITEVGPDHVMVLTDVALDESSKADFDKTSLGEVGEISYLTDELSLKQRMRDNFIASLDS